MKKVLLVVVCVVLVIGCVYVIKSKPAEVVSQISYNTKKTILGSTVYTLEVADTEALRERGLSYRTSLAPQTGMLFVFQNPGVYMFWMKDMNFPIDIIWLDEHKKVVHIEESLSPSTYPQAFGPNTPTQYVIEIPAGDTRSLRLKVGDMLVL